MNQKVVLKTNLAIQQQRPKYHLRGVKNRYLKPAQSLACPDSHPSRKPNRRIFHDKISRIVPRLCHRKLKPPGRKSTTTRSHSSAHLSQCPELSPHERARMRKEQVRPDVECPAPTNPSPLVVLSLPSSYRMFSGLNTSPPAATVSATATSAMRRGAG